MSEKTVYLLPGLGANGKAFSKLEFPNCKRVTIKWLKPKTKEDLPAYAKRLSKQIKDPENSILCGLSFGGIVSVELAKLLNVEKTILISSVKTRKEFPNTIKLARFLPVHRIVPADLVSKFSFWYWFPFGKTNKEDKELIKGMVDVMDGPFTDWCANQAVYWQNKEVPKNLFHIHGTADRIFPFFHIKNYYKIKGGTHFMIVNRADEINEYIKEILGGELPPKTIKKRKKKKNEKV